MEFAVPSHGGAAKCCALFQPCSHPGAMAGVCSQLQEDQIQPFRAAPAPSPQSTHSGLAWALSPATSEPRVSKRCQQRAPDWLLWDVPARERGQHCARPGSAGPGWCSPCVLWDHLLQDPAQESPFPSPPLHCGLSGRSSCPGPALQSPRGAGYGSTLPILSHYLLSFLLPFGVSVFPHIQIKAGILGSAFGDIPDRESIMSPQLRAVGLC